MEKVHSVNADPAAEKRRLIRMPFRDVEVSLHVSSLTEEVDLRHTCLAKELALGAGKLLPMQGELLLAPACAATSAAYSEAKLRAWNAVRREANRLFEAGSCITVANFVACLQKNGRNLLLLDRTFRLEVSWWIKIKERAGEQIVQRKLLDLLPSMDAPKAMESTIAECRAFEASELGRMLPGVGSGSAHALIEIVANLQKGIPLAKSPGDSSWVRDVAARLVFPNASLKVPHRLCCKSLALQSTNGVATN